MTRLINTTGRVFVVIDVLPGALQVKQQYPVLHRCFHHVTIKQLDHRVVDSF